MAAQSPPPRLDGAAAPPLDQQLTPLATVTAPKTRRILACVLCQNRKIRCNRNFPCANCTKANVKCTPSTPAPARKRRRPNQDLQERLARCEQLLKEYSSTDRPGDQTPPARSVSHSSEDEQHTSWQPKAKLVEVDGEGVRFMDSFLMGAIHDELRAMREIVDAGDDNDGQDGSPELFTPDDISELVLGPDSPSQSIEDLWPDPASVVRLWKVFLERVNPLTKVIHVPSLQPYVAVTMDGSRNMPRNIEALLFSIFVMAVVSLSPDECRALLGCSKEDALQKYSTGARLGLIRMDFLKCKDLTTLQALVLFFKSLEGRCHRQAAWVLNGIMVRLAQQVGMHRDGELLGLGPFETEMRRRVWWQIIMLDSKYAMQSGLSHSLLPRGGDVKLPTNINDADMHPSATEPFQDRDGPTEVVFVFVVCKFAQFLINHPGMDMTFIAAEMGGVPEGPSLEQMIEARQALESLGRELLEMLGRCCDPSAGPVHQLVNEIRGQLISRLADIAHAPLEPSDGGSRTAITANAFKIAVRCLEHKAHMYKLPQIQCFLWFALLHFQLDMFTFLCGQLCHRTEGELVDTAWGLVDTIYLYHEELFEVAQNRAHTTLGLFVLKAWRRREEVLMARTGQPPDTPFFIDRLRAILPSVDAKAEGQSPWDYSMISHVNGSFGPDLPLPRLPPDLGIAVTASAAATASNSHHSGSGDGGDFVMVDQSPVNSHNNGNQPPVLGNGSNGPRAADPALDLFFTGLMDTSAVEWDMFEDGSVGRSADEAAGPIIPASILSGVGLAPGLADWYRG